MEKEFKLISMTDFVLEQKTRLGIGGLTYSDFCNSVINYATFLKQPLKLEMFVSCVDSVPFNYSQHGNKKDFEKAKEKVLFEGFYWEGNYAVCMAEDEMIYIDDEFMLNMTIEKFLTTIITDLQLTPTAIKQIFG